MYGWIRCVTAGRWPCRAASGLLRRVVLDQRALVKLYLPGPLDTPPDGCAACLSLPLQQRISQQVGVASQLPAGEVRRFPGVLERQMARDLVPVLQDIENVSAAVAAARGADFPELRFGHGLEVGPGRAELRAMKDGLAAAQVLQDVPKPGLRRQPRFHARHLTLPYLVSHDAASASPTPSGS